MKNVECFEELVFENEQDIEKSILQQLFSKKDVIMLILRMKQENKLLKYLK